MGGLAYDALVVQDDLGLEDTVGCPSVNQDALAQAVDLSIHNLCGQPSISDWRQCVPKPPQLAVFTREGLKSHRAQLELTLLLAQAIVLGAQGVSGLGALLQPPPGSRRGAHRELNGVGSGL